MTYQATLYFKKTEQSKTTKEAIFCSPFSLDVLSPAREPNEIYTWPTQTKLSEISDDNRNQDCEKGTKNSCADKIILIMLYNCIPEKTNVAPNMDSTQ